MSKRTSMYVHEETLERLKKHGGMGESYEDVLNRILDELEEE